MFGKRRLNSVITRLDVEGLVQEVVNHISDNIRIVERSVVDTEREAKIEDGSRMTSTTASTRVKLTNGLEGRVAQKRSKKRNWQDYPSWVAECELLKR